MKGKGEQLKMFMTPGEIKSQYQPLEGDWAFAEGMVRDQMMDTSGGGVTESSRNPVDGMRNDTHLTFAMSQGEYKHKPAYSERGRKLYDAPVNMSEEDVWDTKAEEAEWFDVNDGEGGFMPLSESVYEEGVKFPAYLNTGGELGRAGKPQVAGGHHRIATAGQNQFIPVIHTNTNSPDVLRSDRGPNEIEPWGRYR